MSTREDCTKFAKDNLTGCAREIIVWEDTAVLPDGKLWELSYMVESWTGSEDALKLARSLVEREALSVAAKGEI